MATKSGPKPQLFLKLFTDEPASSAVCVGHRYAHLWLRPFVFDGTKFDYVTGGDATYGEMADLKIAAQVGGGSPDIEAKSYAWKIGFLGEPLNTLEQIDTWAKVLRPIRRKLDAQATEVGQPQTFGHYVARVCSVMKAPLLVDSQAYARPSQIVPMVNAEVDRLFAGCFPQIAAEEV